MIGTELEHCVLGAVWRLEPCTAYDVRREFARSPSAHWSASTGSIYPVVARLVAAGLVSARERTAGRRRSRVLDVTAAGRAVLTTWISTVDRPSTSATYDPVRTRLIFLGLLAPAARGPVLEAMAAETKRRLEELRRAEDAPEAATSFDKVALLGARYELEARLRWLDESFHVLAVAEA